MKHRVPGFFLLCLSFLLLWGLAGVVLFSKGYRLSFLSPDAFEYLSVIRNLDQGRGPLLSVKHYFMYGAPVEHYAALTRPLLFPFLASFLPGSPMTQGLLFNWLMIGLGGWALWRVARGRSWAPVALLVPAWFFTYPVLLWAGADFLSEPSALAFLLVAVLLGWGGKKGWAAFFLAGLAGVAAILARPASLAAVLPLAGLMLLRKDVGPGRKGLFLLGLVLGYLPYGFCNLAHGVPFLHQPQGLLWRAFSFEEFFKPGELQSTAPSAWALVQGSPGRLADRILFLLETNTRRLFLEGWPFLPFAVLAIFSRGFFRSSRLPLAAAAFGFLGFYSFTWFVSDPPRFMLVPLVFLVALGGRWFASSFAGEPGLPPGRRRLLLFLALAAFGIPLLFSARFLLRRRMGGGYVTLEEVKAVSLLERETSSLLPPGKALASGKPGPVSWIFHRPAVLLPKGLSRKDLGRFLREYRVGAVVLGLGSIAGSGGGEYKAYLKGRSRKGPGGLEIIFLK